MSNSCSPPPTPTEPLADQRPGCKRTLRAGSWVLVLAACGWVMWVGL